MLEVDFEMNSIKLFFYLWQTCPRRGRLKREVEDV